MTDTQQEHDEAAHEAILAKRRDGLARALESTSFNDGEKRYIKYQFHMASGFVHALFQLVNRADEDNRERLRAGFPQEVAAWEAYHNGSLGRRLDAYGVDL